MPGTVMPEPNGVLMVWVIATALPAASTTERCAVPESFWGRPGPLAFRTVSPLNQLLGERLNQGGLIRARCLSASALEMCSATGT